jgi:hypothetical protein
MDREHRDWHRLFGLILTYFFQGSPFRVELEKDLSLKKQLLDVVVLRREEGPFNAALDLEMLPGYDTLRWARGRGSWKAGKGEAE